MRPGGKAFVMRVRRFSFLFLLSLCIGFSGTLGLAATPGFSIAATNVTLTASGTGSTAFTLTSLNGYTGIVAVTCDVANPPPGAKLPYCGGGPALAYTLTANEAVNGSMDFYTQAVPAVTARLALRPGLGQAASLALAGAMFLGLGLRRRARHWLIQAVLAVGALAGLVGIFSCGGSANGLTPGTYQYIMTAEDTKTSAYVTSPFSVTVP
jgi:hypothetical protein